MSIKIIETTTKFDRSLYRLPFEIQQKVLERKELFKKNPFNPKLRTHKLKGKLKKMWSFSVTYSFRIVFEFIGKDKIIFYDIGDHRIYQ